MKPMKTALVGCGDISDNYILSAALVRTMKLVKLMDVNTGNARQQGDKYGIPWTDNYQEVLKDPAVETVIISVPHYLHKSLAVQAAKAGKHVLLDKPIATTVRDGRTVIATCKKAGVRLGINYVRRGANSSLLAKQLVRSGAIGRVTFIQFAEYTNKKENYWTTGNHGLVATDWRTSKEKAGGGCVLMNISHHLDHMYMITGEPVEKVAGFTATLDTPVEVEDTGAASLRFRNGALGVILSSSIARGQYGPYGEPDRIIGTHGQITMNYQDLHVYTTKKIKGVRQNAWVRPKLKKDLLVKQPGYHGAQYGNILKQSVEAIRSGGPMPCSGEEALHSLKVILGLYESSETGKVINI